MSDRHEICSMSVHSSLFCDKNTTLKKVWWSGFVQSTIESHWSIYYPLPPKLGVEKVTENSQDFIKHSMSETITSEQLVLSFQTFSGNKLFPSKHVALSTVRFISNN